MKRSIKFFIISMVTISISMVSCVKDLTNTYYTGPDAVEFVGSSKTITVPSGGTARDSILVQLVAPQRTTNTNVTYSIDAASTALTSDYTMLNPSPVVIAPSSSSTWIRFTFTKPSSSRKLIVNLTGGDNLTPSANYKIYTYTIQ